MQGERTIGDTLSQLYAAIATEQHAEDHVSVVILIGEKHRNHPHSTRAGRTPDEVYYHIRPHHHRRGMLRRW
jgi:hypothetical protein